jgi:hypothetical protein
MEGDRFHLSPELAAAHCDDNTIGVVAVLGLTFDAATSRSPRSAPRSIDSRRTGAGTFRSMSTGLREA